MVKSKSTQPIDYNQLFLYNPTKLYIYTKTWNWYAYVCIVCGYLVNILTVYEPWTKEILRRTPTIYYERFEWPTI